ncbi:GerMN domain-containing protein [Geodermatophilus sp. DSM 44513]|uniref:GerMN domain-containing protein n=1 Tax=Geodermatophilus sp. DSM 44513 TaxID=1528104 RepID=UPI001411F53F|nr:GerMN domain-containing protein [Geodermatophilus sp. DSM 44513]WNV77668.1 GerMN domain-containing protein [Geodermatophilus sp. DSM 44513]
MPSVPPGPADAGPRPGWREVAVFFVRDVRLEAVPRQVAEWRPQTAVDLLLAGPTQAEVVSGLRTALGPQDVAVLSGPDGSGTAVVAVSREFAGLGGGNQLLAVAQLVWTVTQFPEVDRVRVSLDGVLLEVPTDRGLTDRPVSRADYGSVASRPVEVAPPSPMTPAPAPAPDPPPTDPPGRMTGSVPRGTGDPASPPP